MKKLIGKNFISLILAIVLVVSSAGTYVTRVNANTAPNSGQGTNATEQKKLTCKYAEEHIHSKEGNCFTLTCGKEAHTHTDKKGSCYGIACGLELHKHNNGCKKVYTCGHTKNNDHNKNCGYYYSCGKTDHKKHNEECKDLICTKEPHTHNEPGTENSCYSTTCVKTEHTHNDGCYIKYYASFEVVSDGTARVTYSFEGSDDVLPYEGNLYLGLNYGKLIVTVEALDGYTIESVEIDGSNNTKDEMNSYKAVMHFTNTYDSDYGKRVIHINTKEHTECTFGDWIVTKAAKCNENGEKERKCDTCQRVETEPTDKLDHDYEITSTVAPTCTAQGYSIKTCKGCGDTTNDNFVNALDHSWNEGTVSKQPTCTEEGEKTLKCERTGCEETKTVSIEKLAHSYTETITNPTCTGAGNKHFVCACGDNYDKAIEATGHTEESLDNRVEPTCKYEGHEADTWCSVCHVVLKEGDSIDKIEHTVVTDPAVPATCTSTGLTEGSHCSVCGEVIKEQEETPTTDHTVVVDEAKEATCESTGLTEGSHCSVCNTIIKAQEVISAKGHAVVSVDAVMPTCLDDGCEDWSYCDICKKTLKEPVTINAMGHKYSETWTLVETNDGKKHEERTCLRGCGVTETREIGMFEISMDIVANNAVVSTVTKNIYVTDVLSAVELDAMLPEMEGYTFKGYGDEEYQAIDVSNGIHAKVDEEGKNTTDAVKLVAIFEKVVVPAAGGGVYVPVPSPSDNIPTETIEDEDTPLDEMPDDVYDEADDEDDDVEADTTVIEDSDAPLSENPLTGDALPVAFGLVAFLSLIGLVITVKSGKKN